MTSLRIIKRDDNYVVQIGIERWWTQKLKWVDIDIHSPQSDMGHIYREIYGTFVDLKKAEQFCQNYLLRNNLKDKYMGNRSGETVVKTYNTGLTDIVWPRYSMPECKEPKTPPKLIDIFNFHLPKGTRADEETNPVFCALCLSIEAYVEGKMRGK